MDASQTDADVQIIHQVVCEALSSKLGVDVEEVDPEADLTKLGLDFPNRVEVALAFEDVLGVDIPNPVAATITSVHSAIRVIENAPKRQLWSIRALISVVRVSLRNALTQLYRYAHRA